MTKRIEGGRKSARPRLRNDIAHLLCSSLTARLCPRPAGRVCAAGRCAGSNTNLPGASAVSVARLRYMEIERLSEHHDVPAVVDTGYPILTFWGAAVAERLDCTPRTKANRVQPPAVGIVPDDATGRRVLSGICRFPPLLHSGAAPYSPHFTLSALKTSMLRAAQISSLTRCTLNRPPAPSTHTHHHGADLPTPMCPCGANRTPLGTAVRRIRNEAPGNTVVIRAHKGASSASLLLPSPGAVVVQWSDYSPPTKVNRVEFPAESVLDFRAGRRRWFLGVGNQTASPLECESTRKTSTFLAYAGSTALRLEHRNPASCVAVRLALAPAALSGRLLRMRPYCGGVVDIPRASAAGSLPGFSRRTMSVRELPFIPALHTQPATLNGSQNLDVNNCLNLHHECEKGGRMFSHLIGREVSQMSSGQNHLTEGGNEQAISLGQQSRDVVVFTRCPPHPCAMIISPHNKALIIKPHIVSRGVPTTYHKSVMFHISLAWHHCK
ncbi:hypothetical protein PR048_026617 [Dryococelus australis]|uniref:Uncharacterized protein n=1 Tax=Dryococelus australis TaxID=614101 RepID=A0ABQ9GLU2_9NEOP|nr:hypothetical protein PR048_026617 [Dryococelus australis]